MSDLTKNQSLVLDVLAASDTPLSAYAILDALRDEGLRAPLQVYRALDSLMAFGNVHRLESLNAFVACAHPGNTHAPAFLICRSCDAVAETVGGAADGRLGKAAQEAGFRIERTVLEAEGVCPNCQGKPE